MGVFEPAFDIAEALPGVFLRNLMQVSKWRRPAFDAVVTRWNPSVRGRDHVLGAHACRQER